MPATTAASRLLCAWALAAAAAAVEVALQAPLTVMVHAPQAMSPGAQLVATLTIPPDAPADLGLGVFVADRHGRWFQRALAWTPVPGRSAVRVRIDGAGLISEPTGAVWSPAAATVMDRAGLYLWSASASRAVIRIDDLRLEAATATATATTTHRLLELVPPPATATTGRRWELTLRPQPYPANPHDADEFRLDALVTAPDGSEQRIPGFHREPMTRQDRGDREVVSPAGAGVFAVRFRPRLPGPHRIRIEARWRDGTTVSTELPPCIVSGPAWDGYVRVDRTDPRFLSRAGAFVWPLGPNLRSVNDTRSAGGPLKTRLTADRGTFAYDAYLARLAAHGVTGIELWMSSWNLALEWRADWPPYHGQGRYSQEHAAKLDHLLDRLEALGMGAVLVIDNHGKASTRCDAEWADNPYNRANGGRLDRAEAVFTEPWALAGQAQLRRYLVARYGDQPAILAWKLWSEVNLTDGTQEAVRAWHQQAAEHLHAIDSYRHPVTTHWSQDYFIVDRVIAAMPAIDLIAIDAYHGPDRALPDLLARGMWDTVRNRGLGRFGKPVIVTEFGAQWDAGAQPQMEAEHAAGPWLGLVSGYAMAPMLWWFEWIDQGGRFAPYRAITRFIAGEDLRDPAGHSAQLAATSRNGALWSRCWVQPGRRVLGYVLDAHWGHYGGAVPVRSGAQVTIGTVAPGRMRVEWWHADDGAMLAANEHDHPGGTLAIQAPDFRHHIAFKLIRQPAAEAVSASAPR